MSTALKPAVRPQVKPSAPVPGTPSVEALESIVGGYTLGDALREGAGMVNGQLRRAWRKDGLACALGATAVALRKHGFK